MKNWAKGVVALLLTFTAGCVDIIGFMSLYKTFTAHMTGLTVHLGQDAVRVHAHDALILTATLGAFVSGSVVGRILVEVGLRKKLRSPASPALLLEFVLLFAVAWAGVVPGWRVAMVILLAGAMGVQTAALTRVGSLTVHTTFVTGMLNKLAQLLSHAISLEYDVVRGRHERLHLRPVVYRQVAFIASIWVAYFAGAVTGTATEMAWSVRALFVPAGVVLGVAVFDQVKPLGIEEELRDKGER
ncbi:MAG: YoaK family protein [Terriglobia bacterium]|nr:YoaK family protein [Terriglobia bacterium]